MAEIFDVYGSGFDHDDQNNPLSVFEAKRVHNGKVTVLGTIVSVSEMYILEVADASDKTRTQLEDAKSIQLEDTEKLDENERLDVILYDHMINNVRPGEVAMVTGNIYIQDMKGSPNKKKSSVLHATNIKYLNRKEVAITEKDIKSFYKFAKLPYLIQRLIFMIAPNVVGHEDVKFGLLRAIVGGVNHGKGAGGRIDTLMVGDQGTAKSTLAQEVTEIKPNSRFISAPHASTKTITAIVDKDPNMGVVLRVGAIPLSRGGICAINEIPSFSLEDQSRLLDVMAEGKIPIDKHGRHFDISSPTTIIATANPIQTTWSNSQTISNDEIELRKNLIDRFTQIYVFRDNMTPEQTKIFVKQMSKIRQRKSHNYNFLRKYLIYASGIKDVKITEEAEYILNEFWINAKVSGLVSMRAYNALFKIAESQAKLELRNEVDEEIAKQMIESFQVIMAQYGPTVSVVIGPRETTHNEFLDILRSTQSGITIEELCKIACKGNQQIADYLGNNWSIKHNHKLRNVIDMLLNNDKIKRIGINPIILKWLGDPIDVSDES
jgi:DNA replicative helicase MCM subunit Mcm2 (Cdc46/Mcm family)